MTCVCCGDDEHVCLCVLQVNADVSLVLERVTAKEKFLNTTFGSILEENRRQRDEASKVDRELTDKKATFSQLQDKLAQLSEELEDIKTKTESRGTSMTDTSPIVRIKAALAKLRAEMKSLDLRLGVVGHALMRSKLRGLGKASLAHGDDTSDEAKDTSGFELHDDD